MVGSTYPVSGTTNIGIPAAIETTHTGVSGVSTYTVVNGDNVTDSDLTNYASIRSPLAVNVSGFSSVSLAIKDQSTTDYPAGTFAGFDIQNSEVVGVSLLSSTTIKTYLNGVVSETVSGASSLASVPLLTATGRQTVGFVTSQPFDEIQIVFSFPATVNAGETRIYSAVLKSLCAGPTIACSTSAVTPLTNTSFPVYINNSRTGTGSSLACVGCAINNADNVIDGSSAAPATISLGAAVSATARLSVANPIDTYPAESYIGFDIESSTLVGVSLLGRTRITLYNNGTAVQTGSGASLLAGATLLSGSRQTVGTIAQVPFDEAVIEFEQLVSANPLGTVNIYRAVIQKACVTPVTCNQTRFLNRPEFSSFIEGTRTGFFGTVSADLAGSSIQDPGNVISASTTDFARIRNVLGVGVTASISVADPADVYPAGTFAGYTISKANLPVSASLFSNLTVNTYLNGVLQESSATVGNLIDLSVFLQIFGGVPSGTLSNVGFVASKPFDEIQLEVGSFASALNFVDVYGAFIDTRYSVNAGGLVCNLNPDFNVTAKNAPVSGNVSTNDKTPAGTTYGTPVASANNPAGATITMTTSGAYSFTATNPGTYTLTVPVCSTGQTSCPLVPLIITVLDQFATANPPVANPDYASVQSSTATAASVTINVVANDGASNTGGTLNIPTIVTNPAHGSVSVNGSGNLVYTPATNFIGDDVLTYQVCETPGGQCALAQVTVHVLAPGGSTVSVDDDYAKTNPQQSVSGNVLTNDVGTGLTVSNPVTSITSSGTLVLTTTGSYTFTPAYGSTGPVSFTYTACDNSTTAVCGTATLHILVNPIPDLSPITYARPTSVYNNSDITVVVDVLELNLVATSGQITVRVTKDPKASLTFSPTATNVGNRSVQNSAWTFDNSNGNYYILRTNQPVAPGDRLSFGFTGTLAPGATTGVVTVSSVITGIAGEVKANNNIDADKIDYFQQ
ncbi:Ig-like domain-containing protein [Spirosoma validum]|nr:Ig-like domain-containing protein [Spirosoma validum]